MAGCLLAGLLAAGTAVPAQAQQPPRLDSAAVRQWREDLAVIRTQAPAHHANLFHSMTRAQFDSALLAIEQRLPQLSRAQVVVELQRLAALIGDGHSSVGPWRDTATVFHELPVTFYAFDDGLRIRAATVAHADLLGARVVAVGGVPIDSALARVRPLVSRDNEMGVLARAPMLLAMPEVLYAIGLAPDPGHVALSLDTPKGRRDVTLSPVGLFPMLTGETDRTWAPRDGWVDARGAAPTPLWLSDPGDTYWYRYLPESRTMYVQLNAILQDPRDSLATFFPRALRAADSAGAERLVLDLRLNGGGNGQWNRDILRSLIKSRYDAPGRLYVITGRRTFSAAQMLISALEDWTDVVFVGEPSSSRGIHYGDSYRFVLPNSHVTFRVSSLYWQLSDPRDDRPWIPVTLPASLTFADYVAGRDPALEAVK